MQHLLGGDVDKKKENPTMQKKKDLVRVCPFSSVLHFCFVCDDGMF